MKVIEQSFEFLDYIEGNQVLQKIERCGRVCYKSEDKITDLSAETFCRNVIKRGHESVLEHVSISVRIITNRAIMAEITRHRIASFSVESTRYCNYSNEKFGNELTFIEPNWFENSIQENINAWHTCCAKTEYRYFRFLRKGLNSENARSVLTNDVKTEIIMTCNIREWRHFFKLRTSNSAHPQMRQLARKILDSFKERIPALFDDITY